MSPLLVCDGDVISQHILCRRAQSIRCHQRQFEILKRHDVVWVITRCKASGEKLLPFA